MDVFTSVHTGASSAGGAGSVWNQPRKPLAASETKVKPLGSNLGPLAAQYRGETGCNAQNKPKRDSRLVNRLLVREGRFATDEGSALKLPGQLFILTGRQGSDTPARRFARCNVPYKSRVGAVQEPLPALIVIASCKLSNHSDSPSEKSEISLAE